MGLRIMRVLVIGASGYIGGAVSFALLRAGHDVEALSRNPAGATALEKAGVTTRPGALDDASSLVRALEPIDAVINAADSDHAAGIQAMRRSGAAFVPTLMAYTGIREGLAQNRYTPAVAVKVRETLDAVGQAAQAAHAAGVPIAFGTDAGVYEHGRNAEEFAQMVERLGLTPAEAVASATTGAARLLGLENEIGRIAPGFSADIIAVKGDPIADVRLLEHVQFVMRSGVVYKAE